jgi:hypothetical protein
MPATTAATSAPAAACVKENLNIPPVLADNDS